MGEKTVQYGVAEHMDTGDVWALKYVNGAICGVKKHRQPDVPTKAQMAGIVYDVGDDLDYFKKMQPHKFTIYPWQKDN